MTVQIRFRTVVRSKDTLWISPAQKIGLQRNDKLLNAYAIQKDRGNRENILRIPSLTALKFKGLLQR